MRSVGEPPALPGRGIGLRSRSPGGYAVTDNSDPKSRSPLPISWVLLTGFLGVFAVGTPSTHPPGNPAADGKAADAKTTASAPPTPDPLRAISDFHQTVEEKKKDEEKKEDPMSEGMRNLLASTHGYKTEFLIATVPDPIDSPYGYAFDQVVEAIQRTITRKEGYVLDRAWFPWEVDRQPRSKDDKTPPRLRQSIPGMLLFRHGKDEAAGITTPGLCVVFLIGENPMGGLHKRAFTKALELMQLANYPVDQPVRVIGPYFAGSQTSLQFIIGDWWEGCGPVGPTIPRKFPELSSPPVKGSILPAGMQSHVKPVELPHQPFEFDIITGNASGVRRNDFFDLMPKKEHDDFQAFPNWQSNKIHFSSTVVPTNITLNALLWYLTRRDGSDSGEVIPGDVSTKVPGKVALLTESNTDFGKQFSNLGREGKVLTLRFPLHISRVKSELTEVLRKKDEEAGLKTDEPVTAGGFEESSTVREGVPAQGGATTTAANAQVLASILTTIGREKCHYVGVVASDTRDKLFLIRLIREYCPDVQVFVTDADQLLTHPDYRYAMRGVLVGSTYPLLPANQAWVKPRSTERVLFPSSAAQGYYNATLMHLGLPQYALEYAPPRFARRGDPANLDARPPVWISVVAPNGNLVPLQVFTGYEDKGGYVRLNPRPYREAPPVQLEYPGVLLPIGAGLVVFWLFLVWQALFNPSSKMFWRPTAAGDNPNEYSLPHLWYRALLLGSQAVLAMPVLTLVLTHAVADSFSSMWDVPLVALLSLLLTGLMLGMVKPLLWPPSRVKQIARWLRPTGHGSSRPWVWAVVNVLTVGVVLAYIAIFLSRFWIYGGAARRMLFFIRAVDLTSGLSPLTPLLLMCMGVYAWAFFQLKRGFLIERMHVPSPYPAEDPEGGDQRFSRLAVLDEHARAEIEDESIAGRNRAGAAVAALLAGGLGIGIWTESLPTLEGWGWDYLFFAGFFGLFALCLATLVRLFFMWKRTKHLLDAVAMVPMMRAFVKLPTKVSDVFGKYLFTAKPQFAHLQLPAHQLRLLAESAKTQEDIPEELTNLSSTSAEVDRLLNEHLMPGTPLAKVEAAERKLRATFSAVARRYLRVLAPRWQMCAVEDAYGTGGIDVTPAVQTETPATMEPSWIAQAEGLVATQVVLYLSQFFVQLRNLVLASVVCSSLLLLAATSYPFHPEKLLLVCLLGLSGAGLAAVIYVLIEMNRDELVSRVGKTTPGKFSFDSGFLGSFATYIVPVVGVLTAQLSGSFRWVLEPLMRVMK